MSRFLELLSEKGYEVKQGKYLAVKATRNDEISADVRLLARHVFTGSYSWSVLLRKILSFYQ